MRNIIIVVTRFFRVKQINQFEVKFLTNFYGSKVFLAKETTLQLRGGQQETSFIETTRSLIRNDRRPMKYQFIEPPTLNFIHKSWKTHPKIFPKF